MNNMSSSLKPMNSTLKKTLNIALLSTGFLGKGEATAITLMDFAQELQRLGHTVTIISEKRKESLRYEMVEGIQVYRIGFPLNCQAWNPLSLYNRILAHTFAIRRMQKKEEKMFDVIHNFSSAPLLVIRALLARTFSPHALIIQTLKSYSREALGTRGYHFLKYADRITVPTAVFAQKLAQKGVLPAKINTIHSHINTQKFVPQDKLKLKKKYGFAGKKIILYYGAMWEFKGTDKLIQSLPPVLQEFPNTICLFLPRNMPYALKFASAIQHLGNQAQIITSRVKIEDYVAMADVVVLPYSTLIGTEGNPSCLLEAMACKTPVITSDFPELREIASGCVLFTQPGDVPSLSKSIMQALTAYPPEMVKQAYQTAQEFSVEKVTREFLKIYAREMEK